MGTSQPKKESFKSKLEINFEEIEADVIIKVVVMMLIDVVDKSFNIEINTVHCGKTCSFLLWEPFMLSSCQTVHLQIYP